VSRDCSSTKTLCFGGPLSTPVCSTLQACEHTFFDELRLPTTTMPDGSPLQPELFQFTQEELVMSPRMLDVLTPPHIKAQQAAAGGAGSAAAGSSATTQATSTESTSPTAGAGHSAAAAPAPSAAAAVAGEKAV
jgi:hypothetical protein